MDPRTFPVLTGYRDHVTGKGFIAYVVANGRALMVEDEDEEKGTWLYGVYPGDIAGGGRNRAAAEREFKKAYLTVLYDIAAEASSFEAFAEQARAFFEEYNEPNAQEWEAAHQQVRRGELDDDDLPQVPAKERPPTIEIERVTEETLGSNQNQLDDDLLAAA